MKTIRKAIANDIKIGAEFILVGDDNELFIKTVEEVLRPNDQWKAFSADDGCRYGLEDLWILDDCEKKPFMIHPPELAREITEKAREIAIKETESFGDPDSALGEKNDNVVYTGDVLLLDTITKTNNYYSKEEMQNLKFPMTVPLTTNFSDHVVGSVSVDLMDNKIIGAFTDLPNKNKLLKLAPQFTAEIIKEENGINYIGKIKELMCVSLVLNHSQKDIKEVKEHGRND